MSHPIIRSKGNARMSSAVIVNGIAWLKGITPREEAGDTLEAQTKDVLAQTEAQLSKLNADKSSLISVTIWLKDITKIAAFNTLYDAWVDPEALPVRACVQAEMAKAQYLVEIQVVAAV